MSRVLKIVLALLVGVGAMSCATSKNNPMENFSRESFDAWVKANDPSAFATPDGIYLRFVERAPLWHTLPAPKIDTSWLLLNYTGYTFHRNVIETRRESVARLLGTWVATTHFCDDFLIYSPSRKLCNGLMYAMKSLRAGDSARIYIPASLGYSSIMGENAGYNGTFNAYMGYPVYFDVRVAEVVNDPMAWEVKAVNEYARTKWGMGLKDTLAKGLYMRIVKNNPKGNIITADSSVSIYYKESFLDGQLLETNKDSIAKAAKYYVSTASYEPKYFSSQDLKTLISTYQIYNRVLLKMRKGEQAEVVATSNWTIGNVGKASGTPQVLPYQPTTFWISTLVPTKK